MSSTANLKMPYIKAAQSQKHITVNQSLQMLDTVVQLSAISRIITTPPVSPINGDRYIVPDSSTNEWAGHTDQIAVWADNVWIFYLPTTGWQVWLQEEEIILVWNGLAWVRQPLSALEVQDLSCMGINSSADAGNRLNVKTDQATFRAESDDIRQVIDKNSQDDTCSIIFQSSSTGVAEIGLTGDNDFHLRLSQDGTNWAYALSADRTTQECFFHAPVSLPQYSKNSLPSSTFPARIIYVTDATGGSTVAYCDGTDWKRVSDNTTIN